MQKKILFPIRLKILITLMVLTTVSLSLITLVMGNLFHKDKSSYMYDLITVISMRTAEESNSIINNYYKTLKVFSEIVIDRNLTNEETSIVIKRLFNSYNDFLVLSIRPEGLKPINIYNLEFIKENNLDKKELAKSLKRFILNSSSRNEKIALKNTYLSDKFPLINIYSSFKLKNHEGKIAAAAITDAKSLMELVSRSSFADVSLTDNEGRLVVSEKFMDYKDSKRIDWISYFKNNLKESNIFTNITKEYKDKNEEYIGSIAKIGESNLLATANIPKSAVFLTARTLLKELIFLSILLIFASAIISVFLARRLTQNVEKLSSATQQVGQGKFNISLKTNSYDEIGLLSSSFNKMVDELKIRESKLQEAQAALIQSEKLSAIGRLTAGIAHEVKNPLTGILGHAQLAMRKLDSEHKAVKNINIIEQETIRCVDIIQDLMKFSRSDNSAKDAEFETINVNDIMDNTARIVSPLVLEHKSQLTTELSNDIKPVNGNPNQLKQVIMNLVINALQAMEDQPGRITLSTHYKKGEIHASVIDNGPGMSEEVKKRIFDPFFTTKPAGKGTGLGLSVAFGIIEAHKGRIDLDSELGKGTQFTLILPAA